MKKYKLLIFDFDGTLVDTVQDIGYYANQVLADLGYPGSHGDTVIKKAIGWGVHELFKNLEPGLIDVPARLEAVVELFKKRYRENPVRQTETFESVRRMLEGPLASTKKAIVTNKPQDITEQILKQLNLGHHFERLIGMHAGFEPKPDPAGTFKVMEELRAQARETIFIGDSRIDAATAKAAGVDFAWVSYGYDATPPLEVSICFSSAQQWKELV